MKRESTLEDICKGVLGVIAGASLVSIANTIGLLSYVYFAKANDSLYNLSNSLIATGTLLTTPVLFTSGVFLGVYGVGKFKNCFTFLDKKEEEYKRLKDLFALGKREKKYKIAQY